MAGVVEQPEGSNPILDLSHLEVGREHSLSITAYGDAESCSGWGNTVTEDFTPNPTPEGTERGPAEVSQEPGETETKPATSDFFKLPAAVRDLTAAGNDDGTATITWKRSATSNEDRCPVAKEQLYRYKVLDIEKSHSGNVVVAKTETVKTTVTIPSDTLTPGSEYVVFVRSYSADCDVWSFARTAKWRQPSK